MNGVNEAVLRLENVEKTYAGAAEPVTIFRNLTWELIAGQSVSVVGESGAGKSTLLHLAGALDKPNSGKIWVDGRELGSLKEKELSQFRAYKIGMIFQFHFLLKEFSAWENVYLPAWMAGTNRKRAKDRANDLLASVGLDNRKLHYPGQLSGGERQRVALARALINDPQLILADEPTGNLDEKNSVLVQDLLLELVAREKKTLLLVTHDRHFADRAGQVLRLAGGELNLE